MDSMPGDDDADSSHGSLISWLGPSAAARQYGICICPAGKKDIRCGFCAKRCGFKRAKTETDEDWEEQSPSKKDILRTVRTPNSDDSRKSHLHTTASSEAGSEEDYPSVPGSVPVPVPFQFRSIVCECAPTPYPSVPFQFPFRCSVPVPFQ